MGAHTRAASRPRRHGPVSTVVGIVGELLITVGVFLGLFVLWQLWWTDVEADQRHEQIVADLVWESAPVDAPPPTEHREPPPVLEEPPFGTTFATFYVPRFGTGFEEPISQGIEKKAILDWLGIGHYPGTQMPGDLGNFAIAGHRTTYGKPFNLIADLQPGDPLVVRTADIWYVYRMTSNDIVYPKDFDVVSPIPGTRFNDPSVVPTQRLITMTACHPMFSAKQRFVVHGELDYWTPVSEGIPKELTDAGVTVTVGTQGATALPAGVASGTTNGDR